MDLSNKWVLDELDYMSAYHLDCVYKRRILKLGRHFSLVESVRVTQRNIDEHISVRYSRYVGVSEAKMWDSRIYMFIYKMYNSILDREISEVVYDIRKSKLYKKYTFIGDSFKDVVRDRKLEELGI